MGFQDTFFSRNQIVCIVLHKGSSFCVLHSLGHNLHQTHHSRCLPVAFSSESIALFHKPLDSQTRKLLQTSQISEVCHDSLIVLFFQKTFKSDLDLCLNSDMLSEFLRISSLQENVIFAIVLFHQSVCICFRYSLYCFCNFVYRISVHFPAEFNLGFHLIPFCNRYISHIIRNSHNTDMTAFDNSDGSSHPGCDPLLNIFVIPESYDHFSLDSHPADNMSILSVSMSSLVFIHKVHINGVIRNLPVKLGV